jgi:ribonuclease P protein component
MSVSKKVGAAVKRNGVRRRLREIFREALPGMNSDLDLVVSARPAAAEASYWELREEFLKALEKLDRSGREKR